MILRFVLLLPVFYILYRSQRYWSQKFWKLAGRVPYPVLRGVLRAAWLAGLVVVVLPGFLWFAAGARRPLSASVLFAVSGLWLTSGLFAWIGVNLVDAMEKLWGRLWSRRRAAGSPAVLEAPANPSRRYFFQTAGYLAGGVPFVGAFYGFAVERLRYQIEKVELPIANLAPELDGLRVVQLSDIHIGGYMPRSQVRRAVDMANETGAELAVVTGDFLTGRHDPLEACVEELAGLRAPLGVWGCNGNHEIYAGAEDLAALLFKQAGMRLLRQEHAEVVWRGRPLNLIGVDYQRSRDFNGRRLEMLAGIEPLVRRDAPNILLSHNPNAFPRAAELGIELTLAGHTHGGQIQVEILHERLNPARFMTEFIAGLYELPRGGLQAKGKSLAYVNRGLGTIGTPVRFGSPPEITLFTLRRA